MQVFKIVFAFLAVGGTGYALVKVNEAPFWLKVVSLLMAVAAIIIALPELPRGVDAIKEAGRKVAEWLPAPAPGPSPTRNELGKGQTEPSPPPSAPEHKPPDRMPPMGGPYVPAPSVDASPPPAPPRSALPPGTEPDLPIESNPRLAIYDGAVYKLAEGKNYFLEAPLGYTVGYSVEGGSVTLYRDGQEHQNCNEYSFWTFARVSKFSVVPCSSTVVLRVRFVTLGQTRQETRSRPRSIVRLRSFAEVAAGCQESVEMYVEGRGCVNVGVLARELLDDCEREGFQGGYSTTTGRCY